MLARPDQSNTGPTPIRSLGPEDQDAWQRLSSDCLAFCNATVPETAHAFAFGRLLGPDPQDFNALVATVKRRSVGIVHCLLHRHAWKFENDCDLQDPYVAPKACGTGLGHALISAVHSRADAAGAPAVS
jgi:GNAT superfamily N-acetyltransferase